MRTATALLLGLAVPTLAWGQAAGDPRPRLDATNHWRSYQLICLKTARSCPSPRTGVAVNAIGSHPSGENNLFDGVAINGFANFVAERYDHTGERYAGVGANEVVGGFWGAARMDTGSDPVDAGLELYTTEAQSTGHNGMGLELDYTANGSTALARGLSVSPQGRGGVTIGGGYASAPYRYRAPADLGAGTLHAADTIQTDNHFVSGGPRGAITSCGARPVMDRGTDQAGQITTGGPVTSCTYSFARSWSSTPICLAGVVNAPTPTAYVSAVSGRRLTVSFSSAFNGAFQFICMGVP